MARRERQREGYSFAALRTLLQAVALPLLDAGGDAVVRGEAGDQTDQESRSAGHRAAASLTVMDIM
jgi:hypothetical protein